MGAALALTIIKRITIHFRMIPVPFVRFIVNTYGKAILFV